MLAHTSGKEEAELGNQHSAIAHAAALDEALAQAHVHAGFEGRLGERRTLAAQFSSVASL